MGAYELNEAILRHMPRKGDPSPNPSGGPQRPWKRLRTIEISRALYAELSEPCDVPGFEHLSKWEYGIRNVVGRFMEGDRWAVTFVTNRLFGRVPLEIDVKQEGVAATAELEKLTDAELLQRIEALRTMTLETIEADARYADAVLVEPEDEAPDSQGTGEPQG